MPILISTWIGRLTKNCPGWYFWFDPNPHRAAPWHAVPAAEGAVPGPDRRSQRHGRIDAATAPALRDLCHSRPGWNDPCRPCGTPARQCGHWLPADANQAAARP